MTRQDSTPRQYLKVNSTLTPCHKDTSHLGEDLDGEAMSVMKVRLDPTGEG